MPLIPLAMQTAPGTEPHNGARLINYFASASQGVASAVLYSRGGMTELYDLGGPVRAFQDMGGTLYAAANSALWRLSGGTATKVGAIADGLTTMVSTFNQLAIVAGGSYFVSDGVTVSQFGTGAVTGPIDVASIGGFFVVIGSSAGRDDALTVSGIDDGKTFNAAEFAFAESSPDRLTGILRDHDRLYLFGGETVQQFVNTGNADFPLEPVEGGTAEHGCLIGTRAKAANLVYWVRPDGAVLASGGVEPSVISTSEIQDELARRAVLKAYTFTERGHEFYAIVPQSGTTLVYDISTGQWHERSSGLDYAPWDAVTAHHFNGTTYFGCDSGRVATLSNTVYADFGAELLGEVVSSPVQVGANYFGVSRLHMNIAGGLVGIGRRPRAMLQTSKNGRTWSTEKWRDMSNQGGYYERVTWHGLGNFRRLNFRFRVTDPVQRDLIGVQYE